ncbi:3-hydroxykynurenine transaminase isoform X2 [Phymastichus coffea]|uniref:3-hydroxykynurenine transaminase isoform X2 n=1 Tax=Phymastichus coffea TaxID=108790 RepID=UPI00273B8E7D|nr:3-hydroxykynurenine transaminase isoform X2 [Phymastichus coffea]
MAPHSCFSEIQMLHDANLKMLRTSRVNRPTVRCRHCKTRLTCNLLAVRDHLMGCTNAARMPNLSTARSSDLASAIVDNERAALPAELPAKMKVQGPAQELLKPLQLPQRTLTGPGPSNCSPRVLRALQQQVLGHMHPEIFQLMDEIKAGLRYAFQTSNRLTLAVSASGHAGMEAAIGNVLERGQTILVAKAGLWGERAADVAARLGLRVGFLEIEPGVAFGLSELEAAVKKHQPAAVFVAHSESSTGLKQPLEGIADVVHKYGGLLIVDTVASLGAEPFFADAWGVDVVYSGSQKVLGAPAGITPISFSPKAEHKILNRKSPIPVFYWDMTWLGRYWNCFENQGPRPYHHTISATLVYGLREALAQLAEEGLVNCWARHASVTDKFHDGLIKRGYRFFVKDPDHRLKTVSAIVLPEDVEAPLVIRYAMQKYNVEISGGLGPTVGKVIRIGLMGVNATPGHVDLVLRALDEAIKHAKQHLRSHI